MRANASDTWAEIPRLASERGNSSFCFNHSLGRFFLAPAIVTNLRRDWLRALILVLLGFAVHLPALSGEWIWDDEYLTRNNPFTKSPLLFLESFRHRLFPDAFSAHYRPVQTVSYIFDYAFWNNDSYGFHLSSVLWHLGSGVLLYFLLKQLLPALRDPEGRSDRNGILAFFVALLWAVHPVHSAAVDYISGRADSLAFFFACAAWLLFLRGTSVLHSLGRAVVYALAAFFLLLALCSRESAMIWLAIFLFHLFALDEKIPRRAKWCVLVVCLGILFAYAGLRHLPREESAAIPASTTAVSTRAVLMLRALGDYGRLMIFPSNLHMERTVESDDGALLNLKSWRRSIALEYLSIGGLFVAAVFVFGSAREGPGRAIRIFGAGWFFVAYLPISNLIELNATVAEHWLYLPSVGFLIFLSGCAVEIPPRLRSLATVAACVAVLGLSVRSYIRSEDWVTAENFYRRTAENGGGSIRVVLNLGQLYAAKGDYVSGEKFFRRALQLCPSYLIARNNLADALYHENKKEEAEQLFAEATLAAPAARKEYSRTWLAALNLAHVHVQAREYPAAFEILKQARADYPDVWPLLSEESELLRQTEGPNAALPAVADFARTHWWHLASHIALGKLCLENGDVAQAESAFRAASRLDVHDVSALNMLAFLNVNRRHFEEAYRTQQRAIARQPNEPRQYLILSDIAAKMGRTNEAQTLLAQVSRLQTFAQKEAIAN